MKKKTLFVLLISLVVCISVVLFFAIFDLYKEIELINWYKEKDTLSVHIQARIPYIIRAAVNVFFSFLSFAGVLFIAILFMKYERLILSHEEKREYQKEQCAKREKRRNEHRVKKILQLNAKIKKLKDKDDE